MYFFPLFLFPSQITNVNSTPALIPLFVLVCRPRIAIALPTYTVGRQDPDETNGVLPSDKYKNAKIIRLGNIGQVDSYSVDIPDERDDVVYIPIGRYAQQDAFAFNAKFGGRGLAHVMHVTIVSDYMQVRTSTPLTTHKGKLTAIIMDTSDGTDKNKYIDVIFRQDPTTSYIFLYLKLQPEFIKSQPDAQRSVVIQPNQPPFSLTVATEEGGVDPDFDAALYLPAVKVELAKPAGGDSKYSVDLTTTKRDTDYVPLGAFKTAEATSFKLGINGWGMLCPTISMTHPLRFWFTRGH